MLIVGLFAQLPVRCVESIAKPTVAATFLSSNPGRLVAAAIELV